MEELLKKYEGRLPEALIEEIRQGLPKKLSEAKMKEIIEKVETEYKQMAAEPGESVGLVSAESIGEPGTQMSLDYEEKVIVKTKKGIRILKIGELIDAAFSSRTGVAKGGSEVLAVEEDVYVPALGQNEKIEWKKVTAISRHKAPEKLARISTRSGRKITATPYHSFVIRQNNRIVPVPASSLSKGMRLPVVRELKTEENKALEMQDYLPKESYVYGSEIRKAIETGNSRIKREFSSPLKYEQINNIKNRGGSMLLQESFVHPYQNHGKTKIPETIELDKKFGFLIGAYLAEGTHTQNYIAITNACEEYLDECIGIAKRFGIGYKVKQGKGQYGKSTSLIINSTILADFLNLTCSRKSEGKRVPSFAFAANGNFIGGLLRAYFDGDGNISIQRKVIRASSNSKELIDGVALLLSRLGIRTSKSKSGKQFLLKIQHRYAERFRKEIGSAIPRKKMLLDKLSDSILKERSYDVIEMVPGYGDLFEKLRKKLGLPSRLERKLTRKQKIGKAALKRYSAKFIEIASRNKIDINDEMEIINRAVNSDVAWDEITGIEYVSPTTSHVYDFSVDEHETFTTFDGIVTHNTLNTFHFAGVAEMNITTGLPRIIEILDGRKNITTPMMEIFLKKPYSQGKDIKKIALYLRETKLVDLASEIALNLSESRIEVTIDEDKTKEFGINEANLLKALKAANKNLIVEVKKGMYIFKVKSKGDELNGIYKSKERIKESYIRGIRGIKQVLPVKKDGEFMIVTAGSNLKKILGLPFVDETRTKTNDLFEIEETLGIEAARTALINEVYKVIENQGLNVDIRHLMLVADTMCYNGKLKGITRYGVVKEKASVLARASFETPIKHIINASLIGEVDKLNSVVENVMLNQPVPVGTGLPKLIVKGKK